MMHSNTKSFSDAKRQKLDQALQILNDAAKDTTQDLGELFRGKYGDLKESMQDFIEKIDPTERVESIFKKAESMIDSSKEAVRNTAETVDNSVHDNPWAFIGGSVVIGGIIGYLLARK